MADDGGTFAAPRPVAAGRVRVTGHCATVGRRAGENVVLVYGIAASWNDVPPFSERSLLVEIVVRAVQVIYTLRDDDAGGISPWSLSDAIARIHRGGRAC